MTKHILNVWPEHSTGKWIVSSTQPGTNNEKVFAECWTEADANLISAVPELLAALECLLKFVEDGDVTTNEIDQARAAIAKATRN